MKSLRVFAKNAKEFQTALAMLNDYGKDRKRLSLEDDEDISFVFLVNVDDRHANTNLKVTSAKPAN